MKSNKQNTNRLATYLTAGLGAGCLAGQADAAITVTFYGPGAQSPLTSPATPAGFEIGNSFDGKFCIIADELPISAAFSSAGAYFTNGSDHAGFYSHGFGEYTSVNLAANGATLGSSQNYANITFNGPDDEVYEAVGQFYLDGNGGGYLVALARNDDNSALSISAGKTAIDAVPEPSGLALLALGAGGLLARRRRQVA